MIAAGRFQVVLFAAISLPIATLGCGDSSGGTGGSGGAGAEVLRILVTNDDGVSAPGIDAIVQALRENPNNQIVVSAPATNQSSSGDSTTPTPPPLQATQTTTASGYPATAVMGYPADSVLYALQNLYLDEPPHVVLSGINLGQNVGAVMIPGVSARVLVDTSGTVGAAKTAACSGVPALAASQGKAETVDFPSGVAAVLRWLDDNRAALLTGDVSVESITSINIPSCDTGTIRGRLEVPLATENPNGWNLPDGFQDCESTVENPPDDIEAFFNGYTAITPVPSNGNMTCDDLNN
ncbi:MAG: 5'/3'-nucleotidase SurE [Polyangiales bacterium]